MSDHAIIIVSLAAASAVGLFGMIVMILMLRESQRITRAVAALVYQESDKIRALLGDR